MAWVPVPEDAGALSITAGDLENELLALLEHYAGRPDLDVHSVYFVKFNFLNICSLELPVR